MITFKAVLVGDFGTGKTSLIRRYVDNSFSEDYISSIGVSISKKELSFLDKEEEVKSTMMLWDIEGKTDFKPIFSHYLNGSKGFIIVADLTREKTIKSLFEHIELCESIEKKLPIYIALNKCDISKNNVNIEEIKAYSSNILNVIETSAKDSVGIEKLFENFNKDIVKRVLNAK